MTRLLRALSAGLLVMVGIGGAHYASAAQSAAPEVMPIKEFMGHVIAYSAQNVWNKQGWVTDQSGFHSIFPKNDEEWEDAESSALTLAEVISILSQPERRMQVAGWDGFVQTVRKFALQAAAAAEKHDESEFMEQGTRIDEACEGCHLAVGMR